MLVTRVYVCVCMFLCNRSCPGPEHSRPQLCSTTRASASAIVLQCYSAIVSVVQVQSDGTVRLGRYRPHF